MGVARLVACVCEEILKNSYAMCAYERVLKLFGTAEQFNDFLQEKPLFSCSTHIPIL